MDAITLRYEMLDGRGYIEGDTPEHSPSLSLGRCEKLR